MNVRPNGAEDHSRRSDRRCRWGPFHFIPSDVTPDSVVVVYAYGNNYDQVTLWNARQGSHRRRHCIDLPQRVSQVDLRVESQRAKWSGRAGKMGETWSDEYGHATNMNGNLIGFLNPLTELVNAWKACRMNLSDIHMRIARGTTIGGSILWDT